MKKSIEATEYLLIKAKTNSEWDNGDCAIIHITEDWKKTQKKRLEAVKAVENEYDLKWLNHADTNIEFFTFSKELYPEVEDWLSESSRIFIELEKDDLKKFLQPENNLNCIKCRSIRTAMLFTMLSESILEKNFGQRNFHCQNYRNKFNAKTQN